MMCATAAGKECKLPSRLCPMGGKSSTLSDGHGTRKLVRNVNEYSNSRRFRWSRNRAQIQLQIPMESSKFHEESGEIHMFHQCFVALFECPSAIPRV